MAQNFQKGERITFAGEAQNSAIKSSVPGPGAYEDILKISNERHPLNDNQYATSDYKNTRTTNFGKYSERFDSDYKGSNKTTFSVKKQLRISHPGPGHYEVISDFGTYDLNKLAGNYSNSKRKLRKTRNGLNLT
jgi:hypothetical protein